MVDAITPAPVGTTEAAAQPTAAPAADAFVPLPKFKSMEEQARAYPELEKLMGKKSAPATTAPQIPVPAAVPDLPDEAGISAIVERTGLKEADIVQTWQEKGELTAEQYAAFKKQGIPKGAVKEYLQAQTILGQQIVQTALKSAYDVVGGEEQHKNLLQWAGTGGIPKEDVDAMNAELAADPRQLVPITQRLLGIHTAAIGAGKTQPLVTAGSGAPAAGAFTSQADMLKAMNDKKYKSSRDYKASVDSRIAVTENRVIHGR